MTESETTDSKPRPSRRFGVTEGLLGLFALGAGATAGRVLLHRAEYFWSTAGIVVCFGVPLAVCLGLGASIFASRIVKIQILVSAFSILVAVYAFEGYAAWQVVQATQAKSAPSGPTSQSRFEIVRDLRGKGEDAQPLSSGVTVYVMQGAKMPEADLQVEGRPLLPLGSISHVPIVLCNEAGPWIVEENDQHGFRNPDQAWTLSSLDIAALGDSFTQGLCVKREDSFVGVLREKHPKLLNLGMGGYGPLLELAALKDYLPERKPQVLLWFFFENDFENLLHELRQPVLKRYLDEPDFRQGLEKFQPEIDAAHRRIVDAAMKQEEEAEKKAQSATPAEVSVGDLLKLENTRERLNLTYQRPTLEKELASFKRVMTEAKRVSGTWNGRILFVLLPDWKTLNAKTPYSAKDGIFRALDELQIEHMDAYEALSQKPDIDALFPIQRQAMRLVAPGHYNEAGHRAVGEAVEAWLQEKGLAVNTP